MIYAKSEFNMYQYGMEKVLCFYSQIIICWSYLFCTLNSNQSIGDLLLLVANNVMVFCIENLPLHMPLRGVLQIICSVFKHRC